MPRKYDKVKKNVLFPYVGATYAAVEKKAPNKLKPVLVAAKDWLLMFFALGIIILLGLQQTVPLEQQAAVAAALVLLKYLKNMLEAAKIVS